jgi:two-component system OmpR family response regulator
MEDARAIPEVRVLVVDDNVDAATSLGYLLQLMGAKTAVAFGGEMALRLVRLFQPMLVLIDLHMPGPDGCEVMRRARALPGFEPGALFVCFSASREPEDRRRCMDAGFDYFVSKPVDPAELANILGAAQERQRGQARVTPRRAGRPPADASARHSR